MNLFQDQKVRNAIAIGTICSSSYLGVYIARNILSAVTPQIVESGLYTNEYIGRVSSLFFMFYACGQLINGFIGNRVKARYMISFGLILAGFCNALFPLLLAHETAAQLTCGMIGFFLAMIYAPMTKVVAENTEPIYATRCSLGYTFASFLGTPLAGVLAAIFAWQTVYTVSSIILLAMGGLCFAIFLHFERTGVVRYGQYKAQAAGALKLKVLIEHRIVKFTLISIITGVVRTAVVFWLPTYIAQYLGFSTQTAAGIFTVTTFIISMTAFVAVFLYERLGRNMDLTIFIGFTASAIAFLGVFFIKQPVLNITLLVIAIMASNVAASMLFSRYCPSLRDTGMVSSATGFIDFVSYMAAGLSSTLFANAVTQIGWGKLILVWFALELIGVLISLPRRRKAMCADR